MTREFNSFDAHHAVQGIDADVLTVEPIAPVEPEAEPVEPAKQDDAPADPFDKTGE